nr:hypothetical protein [Tanacetum cinerariifolium]
MVSSMKLPILKKGEYILWTMKMEQYLAHTDYALWEVILNGNSAVQMTINEAGNEIEVSPITAQQILTRTRERKAKSTLLMAISDEHLARFHGIKYAKTLWAAIKTRFGEGLDKGYDRFQRLLSLLEIHGAGVSTEDAYQKFLRSLPSAWSNISLIMMNKPGIDTLDIDDLYNNLKVYVADIKGSFGSSSNLQNVAFVSVESTSITNELNAAYSVSTATGHSSQAQGSSSYADELMFSFFANQSSTPQLDKKDLEQIDQDDLEEMDLKWQVVMLSIRVKRFYKKTRRKLEFIGKEPVGFDKNKVECFNCHRRGHFTKDCRSTGNLGSRSKDAGNAGYRGRDNGKRNAQEDGEKALVVQDGLGTYDWSYQVEEEATDFALMAFTSNPSSSSSSNSELDEALKEKEDLKAKLEKFETSSKDLTKLLDSQISAKVKTDLGYDSEFNKKEMLDIKEEEVTEEEVTETVFDNRSSDEKNSVANDRFKKGEGYHAVSPPLTGNYMPPKPDLSFAGLDDSIYKFKISEIVTSLAKDEKDAPETSTACVEKPKEERSTVESVKHVKPVTPVKTAEQTKKPKNFSSSPKVFTRSGRIPVSAAKPKASASTSDAKPVNTARPKQSVNFSRTRISAVKENGVTAVKTSAGCVWRPRVNAIDQLSKDNKWICTRGHPQQALKNKGIVDSGCSRHMTGNKAYLADYQEIHDGGFVAFGSSKENSVLFTETECLVLSPTFKLTDESQVLLRVPRQSNMRLGPVKFKTMNKLVKGNLVRDLPSKIFNNDHSCIACQKGKQHKATCKAKLVSSISQPLQMLHMDLFGLISVMSINHKKYFLVVTDDFSRFSWVFFLAPKDKTSKVLKPFITTIENQINKKVKVIRCDNGTEFKNMDVDEFCGIKGIKRGYSNARTPQQNEVTERKNRTLIEAARTMLAESLLPITFWAKAVNTACYVLNRALVTKSHNMIPYELLNGNQTDKNAGPQDTNGNAVKQIHAIVDEKVVVISKSSVRSDLLFNDEDGKVTPLFDSMLVQNQAHEGEGSAIPIEPQPTPSTSQPNISATQTAPLQSAPLQTATHPTVSPDLQTEAHIEQILPSLSTYQRKHKKTHKPRKAKKVTELPQTSDRPRRQETTLGGADAQTRFETASKRSSDAPLSTGGHTLGSDEGRPNLLKLMNICTTLSNMVLALEEAKTTQDKERNDDQIKELNLTNGADTEVIVEDKGSGEKGDLTIAQTLIKMRSEKAKEKGVAFKDVKEPPRLTRSTTTLQPLPTIDPKDKGKGVLVKEEPEKLQKVKRRDQGLAQIKSDAELAQRIYKEELVELDRAQKERQKQEVATIVALTEEFDEIQAIMDANHELVIDDFIPMDSEKEEKKSVEPESKDKKGKRIKRVVDSAPKQKSSKKQKMMQEQESTKSDEEESADTKHENEELRIWLTIVSDEEETIDLEILSTNWKLYENYGVHTLLMDGTLNCFNMLVEKKYPIIKEMLEKMLNWKLEAKAESTMAFELLKIIKSHIEE